MTETPPLRAAWSKIGEQAEVPITGNRDKRVLWGTLNPATGEILLSWSLKWNKIAFQEFLRRIRSHWRGWNIVLFLDKGSPHTAQRSRKLAEELGIELRWLPTACPELNPLEGLWRCGKKEVLANAPTLSMDASLAELCEWILSLSPRERLRKAGVLSGRFWLKDIL